jgi:hypothetical protein
MTIKHWVAIAGAGLALPAAALACEPPAPAPAGLAIEPSITCREGHLAEFIRLSRSKGDPIDSVFALCRDPKKGAEHWAVSLESTRDKLLANVGDPTAKAAVRAAFDRHIATVRGAH